MNLGDTCNAVIHYAYGEEGERICMKTKADPKHDPCYTAECKQHHAFAPSLIDITVRRDHEDH